MSPDEAPLRAMLPVRDWPKLRISPGYTVWPWWQREMLRRHYATVETTLLAQAIGRDLGQVYAQANKMGLAKGPDYLATSASGRILKGGKLGQAHQFSTGHAPWNKGRKGLDLGGREYRFKPGNRPHTWLPIGSVRVVDDGTLERKVNDDPGPSNRRWRPVHRLVWERAHGPVPKGHIVVFKPGRKTADPALITPDALECITYAQNMARNTIHVRLPKPLVQLVQLRGALNRQINRCARTTEPEASQA